MTHLRPEPAPADPEQELIAACVAGDEAAWERLYARYQGLVRSAAEQACRRWGVADPGALAADVSAETFAHLLAHDRRALASYSGRSSFPSWLTVVTRRQAGHLLRRRRPQELADDFDARAGGPSPSEVAQASELQAEVRAQLAKLAPRDRLALQLFYERGQSYREVAEVLEVPEARVGTLLARARERLARFLERREG